MSTTWPIDVVRVPCRPVCLFVPSASRMGIIPVMTLICFAVGLVAPVIVGTSVS